MRTILLIAYILIALAIWYAIPHNHVPAARALYARIDSGWVSERLDYHGIWRAVYDGERHSFERDGKSCRL